MGGGPSSGVRDVGVVVAGVSVEVRAAPVVEGGWSVKPGGMGPGGKLAGDGGAVGGGSQGARCRPVPSVGAASARGAGTLTPDGAAGVGGPDPGGEAACPSSTAEVLPSPSPTAPAAEANRSSSESGAAVGPVSSVESSYSCPHQSSS
ncbi:hypothetical protein QQY66_39905 [Streptomyces sp. DG2A-72]|uniref:hypothetical protein n=1 Tax=Streptomyces sp. DG2A-72 TaxID=3051386 RepID=UPI00265BB43B|nr:hypothetical protein [Streptomyces sp. DG2A-72]MDO0937594.1 hypothetical protein [Streptomyces sp. DG2A-72]